MRLLIVVLLTPFFLYSQIQIGDNINGVAEGDRFGASVSISGDGSIVAIGAPENENAGTYTGQVQIFENISGVWTQIGDDINGAAAGDGFGTSVSISGDGTIVAIGGRGNDTGGNNAGHARVFENVSGVWTQIGDDINGNTDDLLGEHVSLSNDGLKLAVSANGGDFVRVYEYVSGTWSQLGSDIIYDTTPWLFFRDLILSGDGSTVSVNRVNLEVPNMSTQIRLLRLVAEDWIPIGEWLENEYFVSSSLSQDGNVMAISSQNNGTEVYENISNTWTQMGNTINNDGYGGDIDLSSDGSILALLIRGHISVGQVKIFQYDGTDWIERGSYIGIGGEYSIKTISLSEDGAFIVDGTPTHNNPNTGYARVFGLSDILSTEDYPYSHFDLFPNPTTDLFTIQLDAASELETITVYNTLGQIVHSTSELVVDISNLSSGMYYVEVMTNKGKATKKLIIQ